MTTPPETNIAAVTRSIAQQLGETQRTPIQQIRRIVERRGAAAAQAVLQETQQVETNGGMMLPDGSRRRTPGGVYFQLVRSRLSAEDRAIIFPPRQSSKQRKGPRQPPPATPRAQEPVLTADMATSFIHLGKPTN